MDAPQGDFGPGQEVSPKFSGGVILQVEAIALNKT